MRCVVRLTRKAYVSEGSFHVILREAGTLSTCCTLSNPRLGAGLNVLFVGVHRFGNSAIESRV